MRRDSTAPRFSPQGNRRSARRFVAVLSLLALVVAQRSAGASPDYPEALDKASLMPCAPSCTVCHVDSAGGVNTVLQPFGLSMIGQGLSKGDASKIRPAILALFDLNVDSDGDGIGDVKELDEGQDPNVPGQPSVCGPDYGCARVARVGRFDDLAPVGLLACCLLLALRRCRTPRP
jgi:hypothetical protein